MKKDRVIIWFRQDLRLHDNEALTDALRSSEEVIPIYVFDERLFREYTRFGFRKTGVHRARFIIEAVRDLKTSLQQLGSDLLIRIGKPEEVIFQLAGQLKSTWVFCNRERTRAEVKVQDKLERNLWSIGQEIIYSRGKMMYYTQDLPFPVTHTPDSFAAFRREVEKLVAVRHPLPTIDELPPLQISVDLGEIPDLKTLGYDQQPFSKSDSPTFKGGESAGLQHLQQYIWESGNIATYEKDKSERLDATGTSQLSPWLSQGCLSPKWIYHQLKKYESEHQTNESTYRLFYELMWRDFLRLMGKKHGNKIFRKGGIKDNPNPSTLDDEQIARCWIEGRTGVPIVDACMRQLAATGYLSTKGRQIVASFLINDLQLNWLIGASYFESILLDYDPCSNWCNWCNLAGVGTEQKEERPLNILNQARRYDPEGHFVKKWLPELINVPPAKIHRPDLLSENELKDSHLQLGNQYPRPMIRFERWAER